MSSLNGLILAHGTGLSALTYVVVLFGATLWMLGCIRIVTGRPGVHRVVGTAHMLAGLGAILLLGLVLSGPFDRAADDALWVHMCQHLVVGLIAPALWCLARPVLVLSSVLDAPARNGVERQIARYRRRWGLRQHLVLYAIVIAVLHVAAWWTWHVPAIFNVAARNDLVHATEHACLFVVGVLLWWLCFKVRWDDRGPIAVFALFGAAVGTGMIGALITIAPDPVYTTSAVAVHRWGLTRLSDQQLGGVIMWVVGGAIYVVVGAVIALRWLLAGPKPGEVTFASAARR